MTTRRTRTVNPSTAIETTDNAPAPTSTSTTVASDDATVTNAPDPNALPLVYPPLLFSHSMFLLALVFVLPRSSFLIPFIAENMPKRDRGLDRPQAKWLGECALAQSYCMRCCVQWMMNSRAVSLSLAFVVYHTCYAGLHGGYRTNNRFPNSHRLLVRHRLRTSC